jgi:hypothetical protein
MNRYNQSRNPNSRIGWYASQKKQSIKKEEEDTEQQRIDSINQPQGVVGGLTPESLGIKTKKRGRPKYISFKV